MPIFRTPKALVDGSFEMTTEEKVLDLFRTRWVAHPDDYDPTDEQMRELIAFCIDYGRAYP